MTMDDELLQEFVAESWENLSRLDIEIVRLEKEPGEAELLASIFRTIHTIKGTCGFLGLNNLGAVAHAGENVLGRMRDRQLPVTPSAISLVLAAVDVIKDLLRHLEATGQEPNTDHSLLIRCLDECAEQGIAAEASASTVATGSIVDAPEPATPGSANMVALAPAVAVNSPPEIPVATTPVVPSASVVVAEATENARSVADLSIRVHVDVLDRLMNLVGELVLTRNQLLQMARGDEESRYAAPITHLNRVTTDLQEGVMKTRMQPIGHAWGKLPRLVRDLEQSLGKRLSLEMNGDETELDRTVLDAIKDPLTHMVRNAADHGIETPAVRNKLGKPEVGVIRLNAYHEGGHVIISLSDDGKGLDPGKIAAKAVEKGLITEADASRMTDHEILLLVFKPGFSTADQISAVSGRGVGMDVVKTAIERIGGTVDLQSAVGVGTTIRIRIPLTLAIISALVVESGGEWFAIPQLGILELVRLSAADRHRIELVHDKEVYRLRDCLLPLIHLHSVLGIEEETASDGDTFIVVVQVGDERLGLIVSEVFDTEEIVVKPVGRLLKDIPIYQGTTILGDGRVILILDVAGIAADMGALRVNGGSTSVPSEFDADLDGVNTTTLLVFDAGAAGRMAVPLSLVARLEEFSPERIEWGSGVRMIQYRGGLLPLLPVQANSDIEPRNPQPVIVFTDGPQAMGLMVNEIQDIIEERLDVRVNAARPGALGTAIVGGRATDILDTRFYLMQASPTWFAKVRNVKKRRVLAIDDSAFFRQLISTALESEGMAVVTADSGTRGLAILDRQESFDAIISDIEMPVMDGFGVALRIRSRPELKDTPLIAVSSASYRLVERQAAQSGFDAALQKFDAGILVKTLEDLWSSRSTLTVGGRS